MQARRYHPYHHSFPPPSPLSSPRSGSIDPSLLSHSIFPTGFPIGTPPSTLPGTAVSVSLSSLADENSSSIGMFSGTFRGRPTPIGPMSGPITPFTVVSFPYGGFPSTGSAFSTGDSSGNSSVLPSASSNVSFTSTIRVTLSTKVSFTEPSASQRSGSSTTPFAPTGGFDSSRTPSLVERANPATVRRVTTTGDPSTPPSSEGYYPFPLFSFPSHSSRPILTGWFRSSGIVASLSIPTSIRSNSMISRSYSNITRTLPATVPSATDPIGTAPVGIFPTGGYPFPTLRFPPYPTGISIFPTGTVGTSSRLSQVAVTTKDPSSVPVPTSTIPSSVISQLYPNVTSTLPTSVPFVTNPIGTAPVGIFPTGGYPFPTLRFPLYPTGFSVFPTVVVGTSPGFSHVATTSNDPSTTPTFSANSTLLSTLSKSVTTANSTSSFSGPTLASALSTPIYSAHGDPSASSPIIPSTIGATSASGTAAGFENGPTSTDVWGGTPTGSGYGYGNRNAQGQKSKGRNMKRAADRRYVRSRFLLYQQYKD